MSVPVFDAVGVKSNSELLDDSDTEETEDEVLGESIFMEKVVIASKEEVVNESEVDVNNVVVDISSDVAAVDEAVKVVKMVGESISGELGACEVIGNDPDVNVVYEEIASVSEVESVLEEGVT